MEKSSNASRPFWLTILAFTIIVNLTMMWLTYLHLVEIKADLMRASWSWMLVLNLAIAVSCAWLMARIVGKKSRFIGQIEKIASSKLSWRILGGLVFIGVL
ncbi:MAG TPA: hypothetical protein VIS72_02225, partial [Anaerolineales bacterium]